LVAKDIGREKNQNVYLSYAALSRKPMSMNVIFFSVCSKLCRIDLRIYRQLLLDGLNLILQNCFRRLPVLCTCQYNSILTMRGVFCFFFFHSLANNFLFHPHLSLTIWFRFSEKLFSIVPLLYVIMGYLVFIVADVSGLRHTFSNQKVPGFESRPGEGLLLVDRS
jgi:hypothetical protein